MQQALNILLPSREMKSVSIPLFHFIRASEPIAEDAIHQEGRYDLNYLLRKVNHTTYYIYVRFNDYEHFNIKDGDLLVLHYDQPHLCNPRHQKDIILFRQKSKLFLKYFDKTQKQSYQILGTVTAIIKFKKPIFTAKHLAKIQTDSIYSILYPNSSNRDAVMDFDMNSIIKHPKQTMLAQVKGQSMIDADIYEDDLVLIDKSLQLKNNDIVAVSHEGSLIVKIWEKGFFESHLRPANKAFKKINIRYDEGSTSVGAVVAVIRRLVKFHSPTMIDIIGSKGF